jgi:hypothetical protein
MNDTTAWQGSYDIEIAATAESIWQVLRDVADWKAWNPGIEEIVIHGPFAVSTEFTMTPPGQDPFTSRLLEVRENECFVDETVVGDLRVLVSHRLERVAKNRTRVIYEATAIGADANDVGPAVTADFPDVLKGLAAVCELRPARR